MGKLNRFIRFRRTENLRTMWIQDYSSYFSIRKQKKKVREEESRLRQETKSSFSLSTVNHFDSQAVVVSSSLHNIGIVCSINYTLLGWFWNNGFHNKTKERWKTESFINCFRDIAGFYDNILSNGSVLRDLMYLGTIWRF